MDPSEFEGTVERAQDVMNAGVLENILATSEVPKFQSFDLVKEAQDIYLAIFNLQDLSKQKDKNDQTSDERIQELEISSQKLIEMKEDYLSRRNKLKLNVKKFMGSLPHLLSEESENEKRVPNEENYVGLSKESGEMVEEFKKEYDYLSNVNKFIESICVKAIKYYQERPDYESIIQDALKICLKSQDLIKNAQEQLTIAEKIVRSAQPTYFSNKESEGPTVSLTDIINSIANEKASFLYNNHSEHSQHSGGINNNNNNYNQQSNNANSSTLNSMNSLQNLTNLVSSGNADSSSISTKFEKEKKEIHDYYQVEMNSLKNKYEMEKKNLLHQNYVQFQEKELTLNKHYENLLTQKELEIHSLLQTIQNNALQLKYIEEKEKQHQIENEKKLLLEEKLRNSLQVNSELNNSITLFQEENKNLKYFIQDKENNFNSTIDKLTRSKGDLEKKSEELNKKIHSLENQLVYLPKQMELISFAEKIGFDFTTTDEQPPQLSASVETTTANNSSSSVHWKSMEKFLLDLYKKLNNEIIHYRLQETEQQKKYSQLESALQIMQEKLTTAEHHSKLLQNEIKLNVVSGSSASNFTPKKPILGSDEDLEMNLSEGNDLLATDEGNSNNNNTMVTSSSKKKDNKDEYFIVIQQQRNHYMKLSDTLEKEVNALKMQISKTEEEKEQLTQENMELYRRLRVLRAMGSSNTGTTGGGTGDNSNKNNNSSLNEMRSRRLLTDEPFEGNSNSGKDVLDQKYNQLYENTELNPYRIIEFEKKQYLSSMNVLDRISVFFYHKIMKDSYLRNIFLVYLLIVHLILLMYVFQILNPQLAEEVDQHMKNKWSSETLAKLDQHPDLD
jgi:hypothetical protein